MQPFDWSELEVLLKHEQRAIPVEVNKKTILITGAAIIAVLLSFGIFQIVQYYSSLPAETETVIDPTQNSFTLVDSLASPATDSIPLNTDTLKTDTATQLLSKIDTAVLLPPADTLRVKKEIIPSAKIKPKQDKKKKTDTTLNQVQPDTAPPVQEQPASGRDTASVPSKENNNILPSIPDTTGKKSASENKTSKKKKVKTKTESPAPAANSTEIPLAKPDSLKQQ